MLGLRIRLPALFRLPFHLMLALLFLYPLCLVPGFFFSSHDTILKSWRVFLFSPAVALVLISLLPAVRRGPSYVGNNGTPWNWPWFPWTALGTVIVGLCIRSYAITLSFDPVLRHCRQPSAAISSCRFFWQRRSCCWNRGSSQAIGRSSGWRWPFRSPAYCCRFQQDHPAHLTPSFSTYSRNDSHPRSG